MATIVILLLHTFQRASGSVKKASRNRHGPWLIQYNKLYLVNIIFYYYEHIKWLYYEQNTNLSNFVQILLEVPSLLLIQLLLTMCNAASSSSWRRSCHLWCAGISILPKMSPLPSSLEYDNLEIKRFVVGCW